MKRISVRTWLWASLLAPLAASLAAGGPMEPKYEGTRQLMTLVREAAELVGAEGVEAACVEFKDRDSRWFQGDDYVFVLSRSSSSSRSRTPSS